MPAVFQIVSRDSGKALGLSQPLPVPADTTVGIEQVPQNDQDPTQMWVLTPRDPEDFLIQPFASSDFAIGTDLSGEETDLPGQLLILTPATGGQVWRINRRLRIRRTSSSSRPATIFYWACPRREETSRSSPARSTPTSSGHFCRSLPS